MNTKMKSCISTPKEEITYDKTTPFVPPIDKGKVVKIYDGDTITIAAKLPYSSSPLYRFSVRLNGIDTPELHTKNLEEKEMAEKARDALKMQIMNKEVELKNRKTEKYGRLLADVYCENFYINEWLVNERFAVKYDGGTKKTPVSWKKYKETGELN